MKFIIFILIYSISINVFGQSNENAFAISFSNTEFIKLPFLDNNINGVNIKFHFKKFKKKDSYYDRNDHLVPSTQDIEIKPEIDNIKSKAILLESVPTMGQNVKSFFCINKKNKIVSLLLFSYQDYSMSMGNYIYYIPRIFLIDPVMKSIKDVSSKYSKEFNANSNLTSQDSEYVYPYDNETKFKQRSNEIGLCEVNNTKKIKIKHRRVINPSTLESQIKINNNFQFNILSIFNSYPLKKSNVVNYNNIAYYLEKGERFNEAIFILSNIIHTYPNRSVAYINIADAYYGLGNKREAYNYYYEYQLLMRKNGKDKLIPSRVAQFIDKYKELYY